MHHDRWLSLLALFALSAPVFADPPPNEPSFPNQLDSDNGRYRLRFDGNVGSQHYFPAALIVGAADGLDRNGSESVGNPLGYFDGYADLGFDAPWFFGNPVRGDVTFWDCKDPPNPNAFDCDNGFATVEQIVLPAPTYRGRSAACVRMILGHELFHHVEFGYVDDGGGSGCSSAFGNAVCEGQARTLQDKVYTDTDLDPAANCIASFNGQATTYLNDPDLNIWNASYSSALFWNYLTEQYGEIQEEPNRGADFLTAWWELARDEVGNPNVYDITERTIKLFKPTHSLVNAYQDFTITNLVKDLNVLALPAASYARYTYDDDEPVLGQNNQYRTSKVDVDYFATVAANGTSAEIELAAQRFGGDYSSFDLSSCPAGRQVEFAVTPHFFVPLSPNIQTPTPDALVSLVLTNGADGRSPRQLFKWRGKSVKKSFLQPAFQPYTRGFVIVSGWHANYAATLSMRCLPAPLAPIVKFAGNTSQPGPGLQPLGSIAVALPSGAAGGRPIAGLGADDFKLQIGGVDAPIRTAVREGDGYRLHFAHPSQPSAGPFPLSVQAAAQTTTIANAIRYDHPEAEVVVVLDLSLSMGQPVATPLLLPAVQKVREAAARMKSTARFGLVGHFGNGSEPGSDATVLLPLAPLTSAQRSSLENVLATLTASSNINGAPGDGILAAIGQFNSNGGNGPRQILMIGDGGAGEAETAALLLPAVQSSRSAITAIALGAKSDQPMLQMLANGSGGDYHYVPTSAAGVDRDALDLAFDAAHTTQTREHILLARQVSVPAGATVNEPLPIDATLVDASGGATFSAQVHDNGAPKPLAIQLFRPNGSEVLSGAGIDIIDTPRGRVFRLATAPTGTWQLQMIGGSAAPTGNVDVRVAIDDGRGPGGRIAFARPDEDDTPLDVFKLGEPVEISYLTYKLTDVLVSSVTAAVERPDGSTVQVPLRRRLDRDGFDGNGAAAFVARLDMQDQGSPTGIGENLATGIRGSYRVLIDAQYGVAVGGGGALMQTTTASFSVQNSSTDLDNDTLPDRYETAHLCLDASAAEVGANTDSDGDGLNNADERLYGTDPCDVDSDDGGETDGSEVTAGGNPLDGGDDALPRIPDAQIISQLSGHETFEPLPALAISIRFDTHSSYDLITLKRAVVETGPFIDVASIDAHAASGRIVDGNLANGQRYCYQLVPRTTGGRVGAASDVICATARTDMTAPTGSIVLEDGAAQTRNAVVVAHIEFDNESPVGAEMNVTAPDGTQSGWIPFQSSYAMPTSSLPRPSIVLASVLLRDASGNESETYGDDVLLIEGDVAADVAGIVRGAGVDLLNAMVQVQGSDTIAPVFSTGTGAFLHQDLMPGSHTLVFSYPGYVDAIRNVVVTGGKNLDIGVVDLQPESTTLFGNGFE